MDNEAMERKRSIFLFTKGALNCAALALTPELYQSLSGVKTVNGFRFDDVLQEGVDEVWRQARASKINVKARLRLARQLFVTIRLMRFRITLTGQGWQGGLIHLKKAGLNRMD